MNEYNKEELEKILSELESLRDLDKNQKINELDKILYNHSLLNRLKDDILAIHDTPNNSSDFTKKITAFETSNKDELFRIKMILSNMDWLRYHRDWLKKKERLKQISRDLNAIDYYLNDCDPKKVKGSKIDIYLSEIGRYGFIDKEHLKNLTEKLTLEEEIVKAEQKILKFKMSRTRD